MTTSDHHTAMLDAALKLAENADRELWQPDRNEQMAAIEILLASSIPTDLRQLLREREFALATRKDAA
jgi:hypothetical protein